MNIRKPDKKSSGNSYAKVMVFQGLNANMGPKLTIIDYYEMV